MQHYCQTDLPCGISKQNGVGKSTPGFWLPFLTNLGGNRASHITEALVWLRHPAHSYALHSLLERHTVADYQAADVLAQRWLRRRGGRHGR